MKQGDLHIFIYIFSSLTPLSHPQVTGVVPNVVALTLPRVRAATLVAPPASLTAMQATPPNELQAIGVVDAAN